MPEALEESLQSLINRAVVYSDPGVSLATAVVDLPVPQPADGEVLVRLSVLNIHSYYSVPWLIRLDIIPVYAIPMYRSA